MSMKNIINYPKEYFESLKEYELTKIAQNTLMNNVKDYKLLEKILDLGIKKIYLPQLVSKAIQLNEHRGLDIILSMAKSNNKLKEINLESKFHGFVQKGKTDSLSKDEKTNLLIVKVFAKYIDLSPVNLEYISYFFGEKEFIDIIKDISPDLVLDENILSKYYLRDLPVGDAQISNASSIEDVLLSRTYSKQQSKDDLKEIYANLLNNSKMASDFLHVTAMNILNNDTVKIIFNNSTDLSSSFYNPVSKTISIGNPENKFTLESIAIHEIGHYALFLIPFFVSGIPVLMNTEDKNKIIEMLNSEEDDLYMIENEEILNQDHYKFLIDITHPFNNYLNTTKLVFKKTAEILNVDLGNTCSSHKRDENYANCFLDNTPLSLFSNIYGRNFTQKEEMNTFMYKTYWEYYVSENAQKENITYNNFTEIIRYVDKEYLPSLVTSLNLTENQQHFLYRMSDWMLRQEETLYNDAKCESNNEDALNRELIVRYPELKAINMDQDLLDAFSDLVKYWEDEITPKISKMRMDFEKNSPYHLDFSYPGGECEEQYGCYKEKPQNIGGESNSHLVSDEL